MSIDLDTKVTTPIALRSFFSRIAAMLCDILQTDAVLELTLDILDDGKRLPAGTDELRDRSTPFFLLSIRGHPETVGLWTDGEYLSAIMRAQTKLGYALGAAVAITFAREFGGVIEDGHVFFGAKATATSEEMLEGLRVRPRVIGESPRAASERLLLGHER